MLSSKNYVVEEASCISPHKALARTVRKSGAMQWVNQWVRNRGPHGGRGRLGEHREGQETGRKWHLCSPRGTKEGDPGKNLTHTCRFDWKLQKEEEWPTPYSLTDGSAFLPEGSKDVVQLHYFGIGNRQSGGSRACQKDKVMRCFPFWRTTLQELTRRGEVRWWQK